LNEQQQREKFVKHFNRTYNGACPKCRELGTTRVLPFGDDYFFCENPLCPVNRHNNSGYYILTEESIKATNVNYVQPNMYLKRK
jgi:hypothetical protein